MSNGGGPGVAISSPGNNTNVNFQNGSAPANGTMGTSTVMMSYQISNTPPGQVPPSQVNTTTGTWSLTLTTNECPTVGASYVLSITAWNSNGSSLSQVTFTRQS